MNDSDLFIALLTTIGYRVPMLIALGIALVMLFDTPRGRVRAVALSGLVVLLATTLIGGLLSAAPLLLISSGNYGAVSGLSQLFSILHMVLALVEAVGIVLISWALVRALRGRAAALPAG